MGQVGCDNRFELADQAMNTVGWKIEAKAFDGDETIGLGVISTVDGPQRSRSDLMQHPKWTEGVGGRAAGSVRLQ
jgi:hypothetical protein